MEHYMTQAQVEDYMQYLRSEERSKATGEKYRRDLFAFYGFLPTRKAVDKEAVIVYKAHLMKRYAVSSVNSMLAAVNGFLTFLNWHECRVKSQKAQRRVFCAQDRELTKAEYLRLLEAAKSRQSRRLYLLMQTICATGIRVSELSFITAEAVRRGQAEVRCKGKSRAVFLPRNLCRELLGYLRARGVQSGPVFVSRNGAPMDRTNIWREMKSLCQRAGVSRAKVFPHNLRHLFARTYYSLEKDIVRLADLLGHSHVDTTRIYTTSSGAEQQRQIERLGLIV